MMLAGLVWKRLLTVKRQRIWDREADHNFSKRELIIVPRLCTTKTKEHQR